MSVAYFLGGADAFVDAGANVGVYCALLQKFRKLGPMPFYAFEPNPDTYLRLVETLRGCDVETHDCALSDGEGHLDFVSGAVSHMFATLDNRSGYSLGTKPVRVACRRLDSFPIKGSRIAIKVDVEGHEWNVIQGASKLFDEDRVYLCYVDGFKEPRIVEYLQTRGFRLFDGRTLQAWPEGGGYSLLAVKGP
jgi:FkbM family methyltransferase